jgi:hypothetical protein
MALNPAAGSMMGRESSRCDHPWWHGACIDRGAQLIRSHYNFGHFCYSGGGAADQRREARVEKSPDVTVFVMSDELLVGDDRSTAAKPQNCCAISSIRIMPNPKVNRSRYITVSPDAWIFFR